MTPEEQKRLEEEAVAKLLSQQGPVSTLANNRPTDDAIAEQILRTRAENERKENMKLENDTRDHNQSLDSFQDRLDSIYKRKDAGMLRNMDPKIAEHAMSYFPQLGDWGGNKEPTAEDTKVNSRSIASEEIPTTEVVDRHPASVKMDKIKQILDHQDSEVSDISRVDNNKELINQANKNVGTARLLGQMAKARDAIMGAGLGQKFETDNSTYKEMEAAAHQPIKDTQILHELKSEKDKHDPNSAISKMARDSLENLGMDMTASQGVSYALLEKLYPSLVSSLSAHAAAKARHEDALASRSLAGLGKQNMAGEREDKQFQKFGEKLNEDIASIRSPVGKEVSRRNQGIHALKLLEGYSDLNSVPAMQKRELAVALATMISPGLPHDKTIEELDPHTLQQYIVSKASAITGKPYGAGAGGSVEMLKDSVLRQMKVSDNIIKNYQNKVESSFSHLKQKDPERFEQMKKEIYGANVEDVSSQAPSIEDSIKELSNKLNQNQSRIDALKNKQGV